ATLGLDYREEVGLETASGFSRAKLYQHAHLYVEGRDDTFSCVELSRGKSPLLGVIPLEALGLEPDLRKQRLRVLERNTDSSYLTALPALSIGPDLEAICHHDAE